MCVTPAGRVTTVQSHWHQTMLSQFHVQKELTAQTLTTMRRVTALIVQRVLFALTTVKGASKQG